MSRGDFDVLVGDGPYRIQKAGRRRDVAHGRFATAEAAALRLVAAFPDETFIITREVARVSRHQGAERGRAK